MGKLPNPVPAGYVSVRDIARETGMNVALLLADDRGVTISVRDTGITLHADADSEQWVNKVDADVLRRYASDYMVKVREDREHAAALRRRLRENQERLDREADNRPKPQPKDAQKWSPRWNKTRPAKFRELQNIPAAWGATKVVLIWRGEDRQDLRVFAPDGDAVQRTWDGLIGDSSTVVQIGHKGDRWDFSLTRTEYERAEREG